MSPVKATVGFKAEFLIGYREEHDAAAANQPPFVDPALPFPRMPRNVANAAWLDRYLFKCAVTAIGGNARSLIVEVDNEDIDFELYSRVHPFVEYIPAGEVNFDAFLVGTNRNAVALVPENAQSPLNAFKWRPAAVTSPVFDAAKLDLDNYTNEATNGLDHEAYTDAINDLIVGPMESMRNQLVTQLNDSCNFSVHMALGEPGEENAPARLLALKKLATILWLGAEECLSKLVHPDRSLDCPDLRQVAWVHARPEPLKLLRALTGCLDDPNAAPDGAWRTEFEEWLEVLLGPTPSDDSLQEELTKITLVDAIVADNENYEFTGQPVRLLELYLIWCARDADTLARLLTPFPWQGPHSKGPVVSFDFTNLRRDVAAAQGDGHHPTIVFRLPGSTLDPGLILAWTQICAKLATFATESTPAEFLHLLFPIHDPRCRWAVPDLSAHAMPENMVMPDDAVALDSDGGEPTKGSLQSPILVDEEECDDQRLPFGARIAVRFANDRIADFSRSLFINRKTIDGIILQQTNSFLMYDRVGELLKMFQQKARTRALEQAWKDLSVRRTQFRLSMARFGGALRYRPIDRILTDHRHQAMDEYYRVVNAQNWYHVVERLVRGQPIEELTPGNENEEVFAMPRANSFKLMQRLTQREADKRLRKMVLRQTALQKHLLETLQDVHLRNGNLYRAIFRKLFIAYYKADVQHLDALEDFNKYSRKWLNALRLARCYASDQREPLRQTIVQGVADLQAWLQRHSRAHAQHMRRFQAQEERRSEMIKAHVYKAEELPALEQQITELQEIVEEAKRLAKAETYDNDYTVRRPLPMRDDYLVTLKSPLCPLTRIEIGQDVERLVNEARAGQGELAADLGNHHLLFTLVDREFVSVPFSEQWLRDSGHSDTDIVVAERHAANAAARAAPLSPESAARAAAAEAAVDDDIAAMVARQAAEAAAPAEAARAAQASATLIAFSTAALVFTVPDEQAAATVAEAAKAAEATAETAVTLIAFSTAAVVATVPGEGAAGNAGNADNHNAAGAPPPDDVPDDISIPEFDLLTDVPSESAMSIDRPLSSPYFAEPAINDFFNGDDGAADGPVGPYHRDVGSFLQRLGLDETAQTTTQQLMDNHGICKSDQPDDMGMLPL